MAKRETIPDGFPDPAMARPFPISENDTEAPLHPTSPIPSKLEELLVSIILLVILATGASDALAIGDSGGCTFDSGYARKLAFGTIPEVDSYIAENTLKLREHLDRKKLHLFKLNPAELKTWQDGIRKKMLHQPLPCSGSLGFPLDYAVANGNLDVVRWLLDMGVDPNARSPSQVRKSIFARCGYGMRYSDRPDGMSQEQTRQREIDAYRMLLARGANINDPNPFDSIDGCLYGEMYPAFKQLGARVTAKAFRSWVGSARMGGGSIRESAWAVVQELAKDQAFDFRGTEFEYSLLTSIDARADMPDYNAVIELNRRLSTIVRLSPGIIPGLPASPADVPGNFSPVRDECYFPEISAYPDFEFIALMRKDKSDAHSSREHDITEIIVGKTKEPVLLALINYRDAPTKWVIRRSKEAHILGVIVLHDRIRNRGDRDTLSFDPLRPAYLGSSYSCGVVVHANLNGMDEKRRYELDPFSSTNPASRAFSPFVLRGAPPLTVSDNDQFVVGDVLPSSVLISWPDSLRTKSAARSK